MSIGKRFLRRTMTGRSIRETSDPMTAVTAEAGDAPLWIPSEGRVANLPMTRTPDAHFATEVRYKDFEIELDPRAE